VKIIAVAFTWLFTGLGQFYNGNYIKGLLLLFINALNNHFGHMNSLLLHSLLEGDFITARNFLDYQWILNYPS
jgi:hypothetical protein